MIYIADHLFTRWLLTAVICLTVAVAGYSQKGHRQKIVLNDGSVIIGEIVSDSVDNLWIKLIDPQIIRIPGSSVQSVEVNNGRGLYWGKGYYIQVSASILEGKSELDNAVKSCLHLSNGYQFRNGLGLGIGTGIEEMDMILMPLFAELSYHPFRNRVSPFIYLKTGYSFSLTGDEENSDRFGLKREAEGGFMFNPGAGMQLFTGEKFAVSLAAGYRFQRTKITESSLQEWNNYSNITVNGFNRLEVRLGFIFR